MKNKLWTSDKADDYFSKWIRARDPRCFFCTNPSIQNSHFRGRGHSSTRYDPENCDGICGGCHLRHEGDKAGLYQTLKIKQLGKKRFDLLMRKANGTMKRSDAILELMAWCPVPPKKSVIIR